MSLEQLNKKEKNIYKHYKEMYLETKYIYNIYFEYDKIKLILCTIKLMFVSIYIKRL